MEFVRAKSGQHYRVDQVQRYWETKDNVQLHMLDDALVDVQPGNWRHALMDSAPVVAAAPGHFVLDPWEEGGAWHAEKYSVLAWRYFEGDAVPVVVDYEINFDNADGHLPVMFPDGRVEDHNHTPFATLDDFLAHKAKEARPKPRAARPEAKLEEF